MIIFCIYLLRKLKQSSVHFGHSFGINMTFWCLCWYPSNYSCLTIPLHLSSVFPQKLDHMGHLSSFPEVHDKLHGILGDTRWRTKHTACVGVLNLKQMQCGWRYCWKTKMNTFVDPYFQNLAPTVSFLQTWIKTSVKCYCVFLTISLGIRWCPASEALI